MVRCQRVAQCRCQQRVNPQRRSWDRRRNLGIHGCRRECDYIEWPRWFEDQRREQCRCVQQHDREQWLGATGDLRRPAACNQRFNPRTWSHLGHDKCSALQQRDHREFVLITNGIEQLRSHVASSPLHRGDDLWPGQQSLGAHVGDTDIQVPRLGASDVVHYWPVPGPRRHAQCNRTRTCEPIRRQRGVDHDLHRPRFGQLEGRHCCAANRCRAASCRSPFPPGPRRPTSAPCRRPCRTTPTAPSC